MEKQNLLGGFSSHHLSLSSSPVKYLAPPWIFKSTSPTRASQLTAVTDRRPSGSLPSSTTEVTSTLNIAMLNDPLSWLKIQKQKITVYNDVVELLCRQKYSHCFLQYEKKGSHQNHGVIKIPWEMFCEPLPKLKDACVLSPWVSCC